MQFIMDNYFVFIIGGIVVLMTFIGYIAEKTDFGHNKIEKVDKKKKEEEKRALEEFKKSKLKLNDLTLKKDIEEFSDNIEFENKEINNLDDNKDLKVEQESLNNVISEDLSVPISILKEEKKNQNKDSSVVVGDLDTLVNSDKEINKIDATNEDLSVPISTLKEEKKIEESEDNIWNERKNLVEETKNNQNDKIESEEDIWKF